MPGTRVVQVGLSLDPGGTEQLMIDLALRLHAAIPMAICCLDRRGLWAEKLVQAGIEVHELGRQPGLRPALGRQIAALAGRHGATVLHAHHYSPAVYSCLARIWMPSARVVFTEHGRLSDAQPSSKRRLANRVISKIPHAVFAVSEDVKAHIVAEGFAASRVGVIYNGIDVAASPGAADRERARARMAVEPDTFVVGTIARLNPVKDLGVLIRAIRDMGVVPVQAVIVGDGSEREPLERLARELGVTGRIRFLGHRDDARQWLAGCDAYVNCSISEGVSLTILEAMAAGLPVVATRVGGTPEVIDDSCGRLVEPRNPPALAAALTALWQNLALRAELGTAARRRVETRFTLERMVQEYADVYRLVGS